MYVWVSMYFYIFDPSYMESTINTQLSEVTMSAHLSPPLIFDPVFLPVQSSVWALLVVKKAGFTKQFLFQEWDDYLWCLSIKRFEARSLWCLINTCNPRKLSLTFQRNPYLIHIISKDGQCRIKDSSSRWRKTGFNGLSQGSWDIL